LHITGSSASARNRHECSPSVRLIRKSLIFCYDACMSQQPFEHLTGTIERVTFHSGESGFCVLRVNVKGQREPRTVIGTLPNPTAGEWLDAQGRWVIDNKHGQQFKAEILRT